MAGRGGDTFGCADANNLVCEPALCPLFPAPLEPLLPQHINLAAEQALEAECDKHYYFPFGKLRQIARQFADHILLPETCDDYRAVAQHVARVT